jgi:hypothetical protein
MTSVDDVLALERGESRKGLIILRVKEPLMFNEWVIQVRGKPDDLYYVKSLFDMPLDDVNCLVLDSSLVPSASGRTPILFGACFSISKLAPVSESWKKIWRKWCRAFKACL